MSAPPTNPARSGINAVLPVSTDVGLNKDVVVVERPEVAVRRPAIWSAAALRVRAFHSQRAVTSFLGRTPTRLRGYPGSVSATDADVDEVTVINPVIPNSPHMLDLAGASMLFPGAIMERFGLGAADLTTAELLVNMPETHRQALLALLIQRVHNGLPSPTHGPPPMPPRGGGAYRPGDGKHEANPVAW
ncbi:hypothetical protein MJO29_008738 [Puccinia striiformis f. sp. tritici]|nr:hypothetical protein MJO29_008738 [Puccinia striiformis f. sp. tritici]